MKAFYFVAVAVLVACFSSQGWAEPNPNSLESAIKQLGSVLGKHLESEIQAQLLGRKSLSAGETFKAEINLLEGIGILPSPVYLKGNLDTAVVHGLADLVPDVNLDIIRRTLNVKWTLPKARVEGMYNLLVSASEDFDTYILLGGHGLGHFEFSDLELVINAKLKGLIVWSIDYLDYTLAPFTLESKLDQFLLFNNVPIAEYVEPVLSWYLHREIVDLEAKAHGPIIDVITDIINKILCPLC